MFDTYISLGKFQPKKKGIWVIGNTDCIGIIYIHGVGRTNLSRLHLTG